MNSLRAVSWWIRWEDLNWPTPDNADRIQRRADQIAAAHANCAFVFGTHFRWDFMPYWTILHDYLAAVADALHERDIKLYDHHSAVLVHRYDTREEMRNVKLHSGPHLPFAPDRNAAAAWEYRGHRLNDWRMIDIARGIPLYLPGYTAEVFCHRNPDFVQSYHDYVRRLLQDTRIDGLMCDDVAGYGFFACGCRHCREQFRALLGYEMPETDMREFWGNWANPDWQRYLDSRFEAVNTFYRELRTILPGPDYPMTACCSSSCCDDNVNGAHDLHNQLDGGCNLAHLEMCGNTPGNRANAEEAFAQRMVTISCHTNIAREYGMRCIAQGYGFIADCANVIWATAKSQGADCWFSTLKDRLGLPDSVLATLPDDAAPATRAFRFEEENPDLFALSPYHRVGVLFSSACRNHTCFGSMVHGYTRDFSETLTQLLQAGLLPATVTVIPERADEFPVLVLPSLALLSDAELTALRRYLAAGGQVLATGYFGYPGAVGAAQLPMRVAHPLWHSRVNWQATWGEAIPPVAAPPGWRELEPGLWWNPVRQQDDAAAATGLSTRLRELLPRPLGGEVVAGMGFFATAAVDSRRERFCFHLVATDYDMELDAARDAMRFHRSRVNLFTHVHPTHQDGVIRIAIAPGWRLARVVVPVDDVTVHWSADGEITLGGPCCYVIAELKKAPERS